MGINETDLKMAENIIHRFGEIMENTGKQMMEKYPSCSFPQSLLPYPKETVKWAIEYALQYTQDENIKENMKISLVWLSFYIKDEDANENNNKILNNPEYVETLKQNNNLN